VVVGGGAATAIVAATRMPAVVRTMAEAARAATGRETRRGSRIVEAFHKIVVPRDDHGDTL
jgi:hypothetical protein